MIYKKKGMKLFMNITSRHTTHIKACLITVVLTLTMPVYAADFFTNMAINPAFQRDIHVVSTGSERVGSANTSDGQNSDLSYKYLFAGSNVWNNEHNQVLAGVQYGRREFDRKIALPDGFDIPGRLENTSVSIGYKHITSGDWSINQTVRYNRSWTDSPSVTAQDTFDLVGLAVVSREPGIAWAFGYLYTQTDSIKNQLLPVIEYVDASHERWSFMVGFPFLSGTFSPHPDWNLTAPGIGVSYKVTELNHLRLSLGGNNWAYRLEGPNVKSVAYTAQRVGLDWTHLYAIDRRTVVVLNAALGLEYNRKLGSEDIVNKLSMEKAAVAGFTATLSF